MGWFFIRLRTTLYLLIIFFYQYHIVMVHICRVNLSPIVLSKWGCCFLSMCVLSWNWVPLECHPHGFVFAIHLAHLLRNIFLWLLVVVGWTVKVLHCLELHMPKTWYSFNSTSYSQFTSTSIQVVIVVRPAYWHNPIIFVFIWLFNQGFQTFLLNSTLTCKSMLKECGIGSCTRGACTLIVIGVKTWCSCCLGYSLVVWELPIVSIPYLLQW